MAFPVPAHLPRASFVEEGSSFASTSSHAEPFLKKIAATKETEFTTALASSWSKELQVAIEETKDRIRARIQSDLPDFERQLESSQQVQSRLKSLATSVEDLDTTLNDHESGLLPNLLRTLAAHSTLAQSTSDANSLHTALSHLLRCKTDYDVLYNLAEKGHLAEAVSRCDALRVQLENTPAPLDKATVMSELQRKLRAVQDRLQEQLGDAYNRTVVLDVTPSSSSITIFPSAPIPNTNVSIPLRQILSSMTTESLGLRLTSLRKDLTTKFVDSLLSRPCSTAKASNHSFGLNFSTLNVSSPIQNLNALLTFVHQVLTPNLPPSHATSFPAELYPPITTSVLNQLLKPAVPSQISDVPAFLTLVSNAVQLETSLASMGIALPAGRGGVLKEWSYNAGTHYEKKRREGLIHGAREAIMSHEDDGTGIRVEVPLPPGQAETDVQTTPSSVASSGFASSGVVVNAITPEPASEEDEDVGWDFDDDPVPESPIAPVPPTGAIQVPPEEPEEDGWGFDDEETPAGAEDTALPPEPSSANGWGWDDPPMAQPANVKQATRLEKFSNKGKAPTSGLSDMFTQPPDSSVASQSWHEPVVRLVDESPSLPKPQSAPKPRVLESYLISPIAKKIFAIAEQALTEGQELVESDLFPYNPSSESSANRGSFLLQTSPSILDLFRALYPISRADRLTPSASISAFAGDGMRLSNDCIWLAEQVGKVIRKKEDGHTNSMWGKDKLLETQERLQGMGDMWYNDTLDHAVAHLLEILSRAERFSDTGDDVLYALAQSALEEVVNDTFAIAETWKTTLTPTKYYEALGSLVDEALAKVVQDVIALPDIPEMESHRLGELCKILNPLEDLFFQTDDEGQHSMIVAYVPLWLKFSYLAELLEASMADISYLFEQGALVDFEVDELVRLVRALFADTPIRTKTIQKLSIGHPASEQ